MPILSASSHTDWVAGCVCLYELPVRVALARCVRVCVRVCVRLCLCVCVTWRIHT